MAMIQLEHVYKNFGSLEVLRNINLEVKQNEVLCVIGPSGSGKSTLLRCLNHLERISSGRLVIDGEVADERVQGKDAMRIPPKKVAALCAELGMVFQRFHLFPHMTVLENLVTAPMLVRHVPRARAEETAMELLRKVGLAEKAREYPSRLSGGQQQRVAIARALGMSPDVMLFDEPT